MAPRPGAEVVEQLRLRPRRATVERDVDASDVPLPAGERIAAHLDGALRHRIAVRGRQDVGVEGDDAERHPEPGAASRPRGRRPERDGWLAALPWPRTPFDPLEPLDAARADVARHDDPQ